MDYSLLVGMTFDEGIQPSDIKHLDAEQRNRLLESSSSMAGASQMVGTEKEKPKEKGLFGGGAKVQNMLLRRLHLRDKASSPTAPNREMGGNTEPTSEHASQSDEGLERLSLRLDGQPVLTSTSNRSITTVPLPVDAASLALMQSRTNSEGVAEHRPDSGASAGVDFAVRDNMSVFQQFQGGMQGTAPVSGACVHQTYYCGIIDMLQTYTVKKQMEHKLKIVQAAGQNAEGISSTDSKRYAERFLRFMRLVLVASDSNDATETPLGSSSFQAARCQSLDEGLSSLEPPTFTLSRRF